MRATAYFVAIISFLSLLIVFATVPAMAAEPQAGSSSMGTPPPMTGSGQMMSSPQTPMMGQQKAEVSGGTSGGNSGGTQPMPGSPQATATPTGPGGGQKGGEGVVVSVDRPENCLRIRSGPGSNFPMVGCATMGQKLHLTGVFSSDGRWGQLQNQGWVFLNQIQTDLQPPKSVASGPRPPSGYSNRGPWGGPAGSSYYYEMEPEPYFEDTVPYGGFYYGRPWHFRHHRWHHFWKGGGKPH